MEMSNIINKYPSIYNIENKIQFMEETCGYLKKPKILEFVRILSNIGKIEEFFGKDLMFFDLGDFIFLFENYGWVGAGTFGVRKTFVESYLDWAVKNGKAEYRNLENLKLMNNKDLTGNIRFKISHFRNFEELREINEAILKNEIDFQRVIDETAFLTQEVLTYLIWLRLTLDECVNLRITDINFEASQIKLRDRIVNVDKFIMDKIMEYSNVKEFSFNRGVSVITRPFMDSPYLLRSIRAEQYSTNAVQQILTIYSELTGNLKVDSKYYNQDLKYNNLYRSSLFSDFYDLEKSENFNIKTMKLTPRIEFLTEKFPNEKITANITWDYLKWRKYYYNV